MSFGHLISKGLPSVNMGCKVGFQGLQVKLEFRLFSLEFLAFFAASQTCENFWSSDSNSGNGPRNNSCATYRAAHVNTTSELQQRVPTLLCRPSLECLRLRQELLCVLDATTVFMYFAGYFHEFCELIRVTAMLIHAFLNKKMFKV